MLNIRWTLCDKCGKYVWTDEIRVWIVHESKCIEWSLYLYGNINRISLCIWESERANVKHQQIWAKQFWELYKFVELWIVVWSGIWIAPRDPEVLGFNPASKILSIFSVQFLWSTTWLIINGWTSHTVHFAWYLCSS